MRILAYFSIFLTLFQSGEQSNPPKTPTECLVEECARWFQSTRDYERTTSPRRLCELITIYLQCMADTMKHCHGNLRFHSSKLAMRHQWNEHNCSAWTAATQHFHQSVAPMCHPATISHHSLNYCGLFGDPHLIRFDGSLETCSEYGTRPLVDNRFFLVQITNTNLDNQRLTTAVSKITVIIRKHNCTRSLLYEASAEEPMLPRGFADGSLVQIRKTPTNEKYQSVEIISHHANHIEISLRFAASSIHIRRQGVYLGVGVWTPSHLTTTTTTQLCASGCRRESRIAVRQLLADPQRFGECHARRVHVARRIAVERCRVGGVSDGGMFFDACVFDLMLTGDEMLVALAAAVERDFQRHATRRHAMRVFKPQDDESIQEDCPNSCYYHFPFYFLLISNFMRL